MVGDPQELRQQVSRILDDMSRIDDPPVQRQLAAKAFEIAQQAEAIDRLNQKIARDSKIRELFEQLHEIMDDDKREISQRILIQEHDLYALSQERLESVYHLLVDCSERVSKVTASLDQHRSKSNLMKGEELLLESLVHMQHLLENLVRNELMRQNQNFSIPSLRETYSRENLSQRASGGT